MHVNCMTISESSFQDCTCRHGSQQWPNVHSIAYLHLFCPYQKVHNIYEHIVYILCALLSRRNNLHALHIILIACSFCIYYMMLELGSLCKIGIVFILNSGRFKKFFIPLLCKERTCEDHQSIDQSKYSCKWIMEFSHVQCNWHMLTTLTIFTTNFCRKSSPPDGREWQLWCWPPSMDTLK